MFWKKPKKTEPRLYSYEDDPSNRREYIRVNPLPETRINLDVQGQTAELVDISAGGLACRGASLEPDRVIDLRFDLPDEKRTIEGRARVTAVSGNGITHCTFLDLPSELADIIHHYVLNVQKERLRRAKKPS